MACEEDNGEKKIILTWTVEKFFSCATETDEWIYSPIFYTGILQRTSWRFKLFVGKTNDKYVSCSFLREADDDGPETICFEKLELLFMFSNEIMGKKDVCITCRKGQEICVYGTSNLFNMWESELERQKRYINNPLIEKLTNLLLNSLDTLEIKCTLLSGKFVIFEMATTNYCWERTVLTHKQREIECINVHSGSEQAELETESECDEVSANCYLCRSLYSLRLEEALCDTQLKTNTKLFPAHKLVLCARSPVFRSMLTSDMLEKELQRVDVSDLEEAIVERLLQYAYTGQVGRTDWDSTLKLYYAADKYQMLPLRKLCSDRLIVELTKENVCEVLVLADLHCDPDLMSSAIELMSFNYQDVLLSDKWLEMEAQKPGFAAEILRKTMLKGPIL